jgi:hypothetical protein
MSANESAKTVLTCFACWCALVVFCAGATAALITMKALR